MGYDLWKTIDTSSEESIERYALSYKIASCMTDEELLDLWDCFTMQTIKEAMQELDCKTREDLLHEAALKISADESYFEENYYV